MMRATVNGNTATLTLGVEEARILTGVLGCLGGADEGPNGTIYPIYNVLADVVGYRTDIRIEDARLTWVSNG